MFCQENVKVRDVRTLKNITYRNYSATYCQTLEEFLALEAGEI